MSRRSKSKTAACPKCGAPRNGTPVRDPDGRLVCGECGHATTTGRASSSQSEPQFDTLYLSPETLRNQLLTAADHHRQCQAIFIRQADALPVDTPHRLKPTPAAGVPPQLQRFRFEPGGDMAYCDPKGDWVRYSDVLALLTPSPGDAVVTDAEVAAWAKRHDLRLSPVDARAAFDDAASLHLARPADASGGEATAAKLAATLGGASSIVASLPRGAEQ